MTFEQTAILILLAVILVMFIWGKLRYDIVTLLALGVAVIMGLVPADEMFSGFGHAATVTVAIVLMLSYGLTQSGAVESMTRLIDPLSKSPALHLTALVVIAAFLSMFMNNVGALALIMPVAIQSTHKAKMTPSTILMPLSFGSILGGLVTLIGTPPNIIISTYRKELTGTPFSMFDFSPVGGVIAAAGIAFVVLIGWRIIKVRKTSDTTNLFEIESYLFEVKIPDENELIGKTVQDLDDSLNEYDITIASMLHGRQYTPVVRRRHVFAVNDLLILEGKQDDVDKFVSKNGLVLLGADSAKEAILQSSDTAIMEVVVAPNARIAERTVASIRFNTYYHVNLLAVSSSGKSHRGRLKSRKLKAGDVLLLHGEKDGLEETIAKLGCYPLAGNSVGFGKRKPLHALAIFGFAILSTVVGTLPLQVSLGGAVLLMVLLNIISVRELYEGIDWPVVVLLGGMIPIGAALESTGATQLIVDWLLGIAEGVPIVVILAAILIITMTLSDILNNAATAILMAPIASAIAASFGASVDPFLMAVAIGASCAFLTPIGHQNNALVMGPGGYQFSDYWRLGLPLEIIIVVVASPMILWIWPLFP